MTQPQGGEDEPGGCLWCGVGERFHMSRWHPEAGQHTWAPPTTSQRIARMRARAQHQAASRVRQVRAAAVSGEDGRVDLADFLLARIYDDEQAALAQSLWTDSGSPIPYGQQVRRVLRAAESVEGMKVNYLGQSWLPGGPGSVARVLAECEAKRRIVAEHADINADWTPLFGDAPEDRPPSRCQTCTSGADPGYLSPFPCPTLRLLALPYADHPDYDDSWRP